MRWCKMHIDYPLVIGVGIITAVGVVEMINSRIGHLPLSAPPIVRETRCMTPEMRGVADRLPASPAVEAGEMPGPGAFGITLGPDGGGQ